MNVVTHEKYVHLALFPDLAWIDPVFDHSQYAKMEVNKNWSWGRPGNDQGYLLHHPNTCTNIGRVYLFRLVTS